MFMSGLIIASVFFLPSVCNSLQCRYCFGGMTGILTGKQLKAGGGKEQGRGWKLRKGLETGG